MGGLAVLAGALYAAATGDRSGFTLLVFAGVAVVTLAVAVFAFVEPEPADLPLVGADLSPDEEAPAAPAAVRPAGLGDPPRQSPWPVLVALSTGLLAVGAALDKAAVFAGMLLAVIATLLWFGQVWREHPSWTPELTDRLNDRFVTPVALPITVVALLAVGVISFSRLLLAVQREMATFIALVAAIGILGGCAYVASRPRMGRAAISALATFSGITLLAAGVAGAVKGEREFEHHGDDHGAGKAIHLVAKDIHFEAEEIDLPAGKVTVDFENHDPPGVRHNLAILQEGGDQVLFRGEIIDGGKKIQYSFDSPPPGKYAFQCDVHPQQMRGVVLVTPDSSAGGKPGAKEPAGRVSTPAAGGK